MPLLPKQLLTLDLKQLLSSRFAREVAQTCILSKKWRNLWASIPCLFFDLAEFNSRCSKEFHQTFIKFVTSFLLSIDEATYLDVFDVSCRGAKYLKNDICNAASMWIAQAVKHKPRKFQLEWPYNDGLPLPNSFYLCESLEELYIIVDNYTDVRSIESEVYLPNLKRLHLYGVILSVDDLKKLCYGCPMLESLSLTYCQLGTQDDSYGAVKDASFGAVKRLRMKHCCFFGCLNLSVSAPELEYLCLSIVAHGICIPRIRFNKMHDVTKANIIYREKLDVMSLETLSILRFLNCEALI